MFGYEMLAIIGAASVVVWMLGLPFAFGFCKATGYGNMAEIAAAAWPIWVPIALLSIPCNWMVRIGERWGNQ